MTVTLNRISHRTRRTRRAHRILFTTLALCFGMTAGMAQAPPSGAPKPARKAAPKAAASKRAEFIIPPASSEQIDAAGQVFYGTYECEFKQTIQIVANSKHPSYVDVKHGKAEYLMKPVLSSTGAVRLEDVRGVTLMVQISSKSMLLNVKTARREVDECISPKQRELVDAARAAKAEAAANAAAAVPGAAAAVAASAAPAAPAAEASAPALTKAQPLPEK